MRARDLVGLAVANTFRNRLRTGLTALAIVIGALTLALTLAVNTGLNSYIDDTIASIGSADTLTVTRPVGAPEVGVQRYDPDAVTTTGDGSFVLESTPGAFQLLTPEDLDVLRALDGVAAVHSVRTVAVEHVRLDGAPDADRWELEVAPGFPGVRLPLAAGEQPDLDADEHQVVLPVEHVEPLGLPDAAALVGQEVLLGVRDPSGGTEDVRARVVGVSEPVLTVAAPAAMLNTALTEAVFDVQARDLPDQQRNRWGLVSVRVGAQDGVPLDDAVAEVKDRIAAAGYQAQTIDDVLGQIRAFFDAILLLLLGFAVITLLAGSLGIINTLLMSVQERTREIGLLKALGLTSRRTFALFSLEATTIGVLSAAVGVGVPVAVAPVVNRALADGPLADLPGLQLLSFTPAVVLGVAAVIVAIAFLAGTLPAARAARKDPIRALRYE